MNIGMGWTRYEPERLSLGAFFVGLAALTAIFVLPPRGNQPPLFSMFWSLAGYLWVFRQASELA